MIDLLQERGWSREQAYILCSVAVDLRISNIVDLPNVTVSAFLPEDIFSRLGSGRRKSAQHKSVGRSAGARKSDFRGLGVSRPLKTPEIAFRKLLNQSRNRDSRKNESRPFTKRAAFVFRLVPAAA